MTDDNRVSEQDARKNSGTGADIYGADRMRVALVLRDILNSLQVPWYIEFGTLLGAFRDHKFIPHDDDFDIALILATTDLQQTIARLYQEIKRRLPAPLDCRVIHSYTDKIEVYDPTFGTFQLLHPMYQGADFHFVTVDLQTCIVDDDAALIRSTYRGRPFVLQWPKDVIFPLTRIELEGESFPCPNQTRRFLEIVYGSLEPGSVYDETTGKYIAPDALG